MKGSWTRSKIAQARDVILEEVDIIFESIP